MNPIFRHLNNNSIGNKRDNNPIHALKPGQLLNNPSTDPKNTQKIPQNPQTNPCTNFTTNAPTNQPANPTKIPQ